MQQTNNYTVKEKIIPLPSQKNFEMKSKILEGILKSETDLPIVLNKISCNKLFLLQNEN